MYMSFTFKNRPRSEKARFYAETKLKQIVRQFVDEPIGMRVAFLADGPSESVHLSLRSGQTYSTALSASAGSLFEAIDDLAAKLKTFLRRRKDRRHAKRIGATSRNSSWPKLVLAEGADDAIDAAEILRFERLRHVSAQQ
jgi:ribosome-associated translation inhibitor RaiA